MEDVKKFSDLGVKISPTKLVGQKQDLRDYIDKEIIIHKHLIKPTRYPGGKSETCLHLQFSFEGKMYVAFSIAKVLMENLEALPQTAFPFSTTITNKNRVYEFN